MQLKKAFSTKPHFPWWIFYLLLGAVIVLLYFMGSFDAPRIISFNNLEKQLIEKNAIEKIVVIDHSKAEVYLKTELAEKPEYENLFKHKPGKKLYNGPHYWINIASIDSFEQKINTVQHANNGIETISIEERSDRSYWRDAMVWMMPAIILVACTTLMIGKRKTIPASN